MTTRPLPPVGGPNDGDDGGRVGWTGERYPDDGLLPAGPGRPGPRGPGRGLRALELAAGLGSAGLLLLGVVLLVLQLVAPQVIDGADGPGWPAVLAHLLVGAAGETGRGFRSRLSSPVRSVVAGLTILAVIAVLVFIWWR